MTTCPAQMRHDHEFPLDPYASTCDLPHGHNGPHRRGVFWWGNETRDIPAHVPLTTCPQTRLNGGVR